MTTSHKFRRTFLMLCALIVSLIFFTQQAKSNDFLDPEVAFQTKARMVSKDKLEVTFIVAKDYYLYREKFKFEALGAKLGEPAIPKGKIKYDETFAKDVESFYNGVTVTIPIEATKNFQLKVGMQGCADLGLCYPPMEKVIAISINEIGKSYSFPVDEKKNSFNTEVEEELNELGYIAQALQTGDLIVIIPLFILLGLGLSFTPCVLPMVPILSFIIVGEGKDIKRSRSFLLSLCYVMGMALVYTALGVSAGMIGEGLSASLQKPWVLSSFALLMVVLAMSMFGFYDLQIPASIQTKLSTWSQAKQSNQGNQGNAKYIAVFFMGAVSALIVGPCVAAPLAGALMYISQTKDVIVGGSALFSMAIGMGIPLLLIGLSAGSLLPKAGAWMESIKHFFGILMLGLALWMLMPILPVWIAMLAWALLLGGYGIYLVIKHAGKLKIQVIGIVIAAMGLLQLVGVATGGRDAWSPISHLVGTVQHTQFQRVKTLKELQSILANNKDKVVMLDFYADWCVSCIEMEKFTFTDAKVKTKLDQMLLLQVDVTAHNDEDKILLKQFGLFGPPGILFFDTNGLELTERRVIGYQKAESFLKVLEKVNQETTN